MFLQVIIEVPDADFVCFIDTIPIIVSVSTVAAILVLILVSLLLTYKYRGEIKLILYMKFRWHPFDCSDDTDIMGKVRRDHFNIQTDLSGINMELCIAKIRLSWDMRIFILGVHTLLRRQLYIDMASMTISLFQWEGLTYTHHQCRSATALYFTEKSLLLPTSYHWNCQSYTF